MERMLSVGVVLLVVVMRCAQVGGLLSEIRCAVRRRQPVSEKKFAGAKVV
jgi:hypothetical protein